MKKAGEVQKRVGGVEKSQPPKSNQSVHVHLISAHFPGRTLCTLPLTPKTTKGHYTYRTNSKTIVLALHDIFPSKFRCSGGMVSFTKWFI
jgi:hypothetical protein